MVTRRESVEKVFRPLRGVMVFLARQEPKTSYHKRNDEVYRVPVWLIATGSRFLIVASPFSHGGLNLMRRTTALP